MTLSTESDGSKTTIAAPKVEAVPGGRRYSGSAGGHTIVVTVLDTVCTDTMTGVPRPNTVEVARDGKAFKGCGGDPAALLRGQPWSVTDINGSALVERSRIVISFGPTGRVSGNASCNGFGGTYTITGEGLRFGETVATKRACLGPLMQQEAAFLGVLGAVNRFAISAGGALVLHTADGRTITATRLKPPAK
jgi:heat shock protein HslJ